MEYIGRGAFNGCNALWSVTYNAVNAECAGGVSPRDDGVKAGRRTAPGVYIVRRADGSTAKIVRR